MTQKYLRIILAVIIVVAAPIAWWYAKSVSPNLKSGSNPADQILSSEYKVDDVGARSFGKLTALTGNNTDAAKPQTMAMGNSAGVAVGIGGGGPAIAPDAKILPPYNPEIYKFKYKGEDLTDLSSDQPVYKRIPENFSSSAVDRVIRSLSLGLIDLTAFNSTKLQNFSFSEDQSFGYSIYVDAQQGSVNVYQNYNQWPQPYKDCTDQNCVQSHMLKLKDIPDDQTLIDMANQFVQDKHVSLSGYGEPVVAADWRETYANSTDKTNFYFPETIDVVYPLMIDNQAAYDDSGALSGLHISIDIRNRRAAGLYDLTTKRYQKSNYGGVTDANKIISVAEKGGYHSYYDANASGGKTVTLELDTPTKQFLRVWKYDNNTSEELFVPALIFPIKNPGNYWRKNVIVPLVQEVLDNDNQPPLMYMEGMGSASGNVGVKVMQ